ncbi:MAG: UDP-glucose 4-epimerase GalE [Bdellovibrionales bacterium RIFCSPHIGHO2_01_FULL_40_29]|nr:MAG: UDP-glucose 4-epimerase GalE [Bdellovibrionales bacterium RIFCSPHIGHO2_01_FULL_40_29]OFZ34471.1 MAG: UDP-glucose 4-epimerase GalE [Bdellovibrionales bacterium RIFCSPHIGHO2_02_FULL_40_15]
MVDAVRILITGGAGYIGSCLTHFLCNQGYSVTVFDDLSTGFKDAVHENAQFVHGTICEPESLSQTLNKYQINFVIHLAAKLNVAESFNQEATYHQINVQGTKNVIQCCLDNDIAKIIFSSSSTIYGDLRNGQFCFENEIVQPISPYGASKRLCEELFATAFVEYGLSSICFRYFNVAGAMENLVCGQRTAFPYHLVHVVSQAAFGKTREVSIYGKDYPTVDGTCVRDYIHIDDVIQANIQGIEYLLNNNSATILNCGSGIGTSVQQVISQVMVNSLSAFDVQIKERRPGDPAYLISSNEKIISTLKWSPQFSEISKICQSAIDWEAKLNTKV